MVAIPPEVDGIVRPVRRNGPEPTGPLIDGAKALFPGTAALLLIAVAALLLLFVLGYPNPGRSYQQVHPSEIVSLINQGQVKSALIADKNQTIQITTKNGKQFEASWASSQGSQLQNALQAQLDQGRLPGGYNVNSAQSSALLDVLVPASVYLVIFLLFLWRIDFPAEIKWWRALADQAGQMAKRWEQQT